MLNIQHIVKHYAEHTALDDVSMEVERGSIFGLLGPNGAGKTSLIRIINQITAPDNGQILFNGEKLSPDHIARIGYLPEERGLYKKMEIGEQVLYFARLKGLSRADARERIRYWFKKMEMQDWWKKKVEELSKGMQQKVQFVATVLHEPELLILDEPFSGFDPVNADIIKEEILELNKKGATIIFSTHRMESVEQLCDSIALINKAKKVLEGRVSDVKNRYRTNTYEISFEGSLSDQLSPAGGEFEILERQNGYIKVKISPDRTPNELLNGLMQQVEVHRFSEIIPSIHDIFIRSVTEGITDREIPAENPL